MKPIEHSPEVRRLRRVGRFALLWAVVICGRLIYLQVYKHDELLKLAVSQWRQDVEIKAPRGTMLDRNGEQLVVSVPVDSLAINPRPLKEPEVAADLLARVLHMDAGELLDRIERYQKQNLAFMWVKRKLEPEESQALRALKADWMDFREESRRVYVNGTLAANLIGSVDYQEDGNAGIELSYQEDLQGKPGRVKLLTDVRGRGIESLVELAPRPGKTLALTIDERLQYVSDSELQKAVEANGATSGTAIAMDPHTGEVLALSSYPSFDPNEPLAPGTDLSVRMDRAVSEPFEPGSVMKAFTISTAMETTDLTPQTIINCGNGRMAWYGNIIHDARGHEYSELPVEEVLWHSSNVGAANIGRRIGADTLYRYLHQRFAFGTPTGVQLPAESSGILHNVKDWTPGSVAYVAFGHEIAVTTMQLARAVSVIANGGKLVQPKVVLWKQRQGGLREKVASPEAKQVLKPETSILMRKMMEGVVLNGTGTKAKVAGYTTAGKTGTAEIFDFELHHYTQKNNSSFMGFAPIGDPKVVVVVVLNGVRAMASQVAAPVFREIASTALRLKGVTRDVPDPLPGEEVQGKPPLRLAKAETEEAPEPERDPGVIVGPRVPDFRGKSMRSVMRSSIELGVQIEIVGTGLAREQDPPAGSILEAGRPVRVLFSR